MPKAKLPTSTKGWLVALLASFAGFIAGFITIALCEKYLP
jgi:hypothetical protein